MLEKKHLVFLAGATAPFAPPLCTALQKVVFVQYFNYFFSCFCCFLYVCCLELTEQAFVCLKYSKHPQYKNI